MAVCVVIFGRPRIKVAVFMFVGLGLRASMCRHSGHLCLRDPRPSQADASCPESVLLMMCMTAMLTFPPATSKLA